MFPGPFVRPERKLIDAATGGDLQTAKDVIKDGVNVNHQNEHGSSALVLASELGHLGIVEVLLKCSGININLQNKVGNTALISASIHGYLDIVKVLLGYDDIDVNLSNIFGDTALIRARTNGYMEIVRCLEDFDKKSVIGCQNSAASGETEKDYSNLIHQSTLETTHLTSIDDIIMQSREKLRRAMIDSTSDPIDIALEYVDHCITDTVLGEGAFGIVYLANDNKLPKKFVIKKIKFRNGDEETIRDIHKGFKTEISALKRFRHPNIIAMYGYTLSLHHTQKCLIYEYAANGSLDSFLQCDANRSSLPSYIRLSIILDMTKAVHFLHTGGCNGYLLYHRDIKSANICLSEDFTAQLIDCGLAKFVPIDGSPSTTTSVTNYHSLGNIFGTPGYMCPEYLYKKIKGLNYEYQPACDVYSMGVVMVELILGCLIAGRSSQSGKTCRNFHQKYVENDNGRLIPNGWKLLKDDVDPCISWHPDALDCVCRAAISCLHPSAKQRISTQNLLRMLYEAVHLNAGAGVIYQAYTPNSDGLKCDICNQSLSASQKTSKCSEGHMLCQACMDNSILLHLPSGKEAHCPFVSCTSQPFTEEELYGLISHQVFTAYAGNLKALEKLESKLNDLVSEINCLQSAVNQQNLQNENLCSMITSELRKFDTLASGLDRALSLLALLGAQHIKQCPNLVWISPVTPKSTKPRNWLKEMVKNTFLVTFICAHSGKACHEPFEIHVSKGRVVKVAPFLQISLYVLKTMTNASGLPFPIPYIPSQDQFLWMQSFLDDIIDRESLMCERIIEQGTITMDSYTSMQEVYGNAFDLIARKALKDDKFPYWKGKLVPVCDKEKGIIWVMPKFKNLYFIV